MNARTPFPGRAKTPKLPKLPKPPAAAKLRQRQRADQEFLPAALEILETPPSPVGIWLLWIICFMAVAALTWSYFGRLDVVAVAQGKIQPTGRVKVIQPLETGRVASVAVENGQHVAKGQALVSFDSGEADADVNQLSADLAAYQAEAARRRAAKDALADRIIEPIPAIEWPEASDSVIPEEIKARETQVLVGDLEKLASTIAGLDAQRQQKQREGERYAANASAMEDLVETLQSRVNMRASLKKSGSGSKADLIDATQVMQEQKATLATARGQIAESAATVEVYTRQIEDTYRTFLADNGQKLNDAERKIDEDRQLLAKARVRQNRTVLASPIDGTVSALSITTVGQVVGAGDEVMRIVPDGIVMASGSNPAGKGDASQGRVTQGVVTQGGVTQGGVTQGVGIEIEAYIANRDIGFVKPGQEAIVKIESLPFTRYGTIDATLTRVASDAIPEPDAAQQEGNPIQSVRDRGFAGAQRTQNLVFPATFRPAATSLMADGASVPLTPGMAVTVEIKTGSRRILEYLFSPLVEVAKTSMKER